MASMLKTETSGKNGSPVILTVIPCNWMPWKRWIIHFDTREGRVNTEVLLDSGAQINSVGERTKEGMEVMKRAKGEYIEVCSPLGKCSRCAVGSARGCLTCKNKQVTFDEKFVVLPGSADTPILGIKSIREMDLVG